MAEETTKIEEAPVASGSESKSQQTIIKDSLEEGLVPEQHPIPTVNEVPVAEPTEDQTLETDYRSSPHFYEIANFFQIPPQEYEAAKYKLSLITDWAAQQAGSNKLEDMMMKIRQLERSIPPAEAGEKRFLNVFRFIKLSQQPSSTEHKETASTQAQNTSLFYDAALYFKVNPQTTNEEVRHQLSAIVAWATDNGQLKNDIIPKIRALENVIPRPTWGEKRYKNVFRYLHMGVGLN